MTSSPSARSPSIPRGGPRRFEALRDNDFWAAYRGLPADVRELADKNYQLLKSDPQHPSLQFKTIGRFRSVRVGLHYRGLGVEVPDGVSWFWIGTHAEYNRLIG